MRRSTKGYGANPQRCILIFFLFKSFRRETHKEVN